MKTPHTVILSDSIIAALDSPQSFLAQLEAKQDLCKHTEPLIPAQSGHSVCLQCWKSWSTNDLQPVPVAG